MIDCNIEIPAAIIEMEAGLRPLTVEPVITPTGAAIWYIDSTGEQNTYIVVDMADAEQYVFFTHDRTSKEWKCFTKEERAMMRTQHSDDRS